MKECIFYRPENKDCKILKQLDCENCSFCKTGEEFVLGKEKAKEILLKKGLKAIKINKNGELYVTTIHIDLISEGE